MLRAVVLSLVLFIGLCVALPLATDLTQAQQSKSRKYKKQKKVKKYSKQWWRLYRAKQKRKKELAARKRALRLEQLRRTGDPAGEGKWVVETTWNGDKWVSRQVWVIVGEPYPSPWETRPEPAAAVAVSPATETLKQAAPVRKPAEAPPGELQFKVNNTSGLELGSASISVVGPAVGESRGAGLYKTLAGVSTGSLRRIVIDQMIRENGWVVNDYQKEVGGQQIYVVVAQSPGAGGAMQSRMFYFAEVDGRIFSVATNSPVNKSGQIADEAEKVVTVLRRNQRATQAGMR